MKQTVRKHQWRAADILNKDCCPSGHRLHCRHCEMLKGGVQKGKNNTQHQTREQRPLFKHRQPHPEAFFHCVFYRITGYLLTLTFKGSALCGKLTYGLLKQLENVTDLVELMVTMQIGQNCFISWPV